MPVSFSGLLEDVNGYEGKNGFGANIIVSQKVGNRIKRLEFIIKDKDLAMELEKLLMNNVDFVVALDQNNFGMRFGEVYEYSKSKVS